MPEAEAQSRVYVRSLIEALQAVSPKPDPSLYNLPQAPSSTAGYRHITESTAQRQKVEKDSWYETKRQRERDVPFGKFQKLKTVLCPQHLR